MKSISRINPATAVAFSVTAVLHATLVYSVLNQNFDSPIQEVTPKSVQVKFIQLPKADISPQLQPEHAPTQEPAQSQVMPPVAAPVQSAPTQPVQPVKAKPVSNQSAKARPEPNPQPKIASSQAMTDHTSTTMQTTAVVTHEAPPAPAQPAATTQPAPSVSKPIVAENTQPPPVFDEKNYKPISKVKPDYPMRALENELEGNCTVEYSVNTQGQVVNPKALTDCDPIFVRPSLNAARQFKYQPRIVNGQAVEVAKIKNTFEYRIE